MSLFGTYDNEPKEFTPRRPSITDTEIEQYKFHREFYYLTQKSIENNTFTFLLGPRKCGKTVCLKQLLKSFIDSGMNVRYYDFKALKPGNNQLDVFDEIYRSLKKDENKIYLLDEITHLENAELHICGLAGEAADKDIKNMKVLFTGSQSVALNAWANKAFAGNTGKIYADFLTYPEYLEYSNLSIVSEETYLDFIYNASKFYKFNASLEEYLTACLNETIISNSNSVGYIFNNDCDLLVNNVDVLVNICYQTLFSLHNQSSHKSFYDRKRLPNDIVGYFRSVCHGLTKEIAAEKIEHSFIKSYNYIQSVKPEILRQAYTFLDQCGLVTITPIARNFQDVPDVYADFLSPRSRFDLKNNLFNEYNMTINYPMFYIRIMQDILGPDMPAPENLSRLLLGSIVECHARGMLPRGFEYKTFDDKEIDYISLDKSKSVEFTIADSHVKNFYLIPESWECQPTILTRTVRAIKNGINHIPYYEYLYELSGGDYSSGIARVNIKEDALQTIVKPENFSENNTSQVTNENSQNEFTKDSN